MILRMVDAEIFQIVSIQLDNFRCVNFFAQLVISVTGMGDDEHMGQIRPFDQIR